MNFDKIKMLRAIEVRDGTWMLEGAYYKMKNIYSSNGFNLIAMFNAFEECKIFSDLNLSNIKLHVISNQDCLRHCWFS